MTAETHTIQGETAGSADVSVVRNVFEAIAKRDFTTVSSLFDPSATWNHRNDDRFGGVHHGPAEIMAFMGEGMQLTNGTLQPVPESMMADGRGRVAALIRLRGTRPDGRTTDDLQLLVFAIGANRVQSVEHFVGDPAAVAAFWA